MDEKTREHRYYTDSIFWVETERILPNPFQPRVDFDEGKLRELADSIRQYGVLQPLTVTRREVEDPERGIFVEYELIAGERRLRASRLASVKQVPVIIRSQEEDDLTKLELAIIENLQREDLNPLDRAKAFGKLSNDFGMKHVQIAEKVGRSREFVSNTIRMLAMPEVMQQALFVGQISEGHTRPLLMLNDKPEEQNTLFREIVDKKMTVRDSEKIARRIAVDKARKKDLSPELLTMEKKLTETLGTRVRIEQKDGEGKDLGGKVLIDFFSAEDLNSLLEKLAAQQAELEALKRTMLAAGVASLPQASQETATEIAQPSVYTEIDTVALDAPVVMSTPEEDEEEALYSMKSFSL
jgi:ParB family transcriptional regulator, chromosome partitioning protein